MLGTEHTVKIGDGRLNHGSERPGPRGLVGQAQALRRRRSPLASPPAQGESAWGVIRRDTVSGLGLEEGDTTPACSGPMCDIKEGPYMSQSGKGSPPTHNTNIKAPPSSGTPSSHHRLGHFCSPTGKGPKSIFDNS